MITANLTQRILDSEARYNEVQERRNAHLEAAEADLLEMHKLQGEYRVLRELEAEEANKQATVIEAVPEKEDK